MITEKELHKLLEDHYPDNPNLDNLKLLLSDNVSEESEIHIKSSLQNKEAHLFILNFADFMNRFENENLYN
jgi:hypothetical protein